MKFKHLLSGLLMMLMLSQATAQSDYFFPEGSRFDPNIPTPEEYLGYPVGTLHTRHDAIVGYMKELASKSDRAKFEIIGETYEHRKLVVLTVSAPRNIENLESIRKDHLELVDPDKHIGDYADHKSVVLLGYNVHGNEPSSSEAALLAAYYYVAGLHNEVTTALDEAVIMHFQKKHQILNYI